MSNSLKFYIDGAWVDSVGGDRLAVVNPATEETVGEISLGTAADVDRAVAAARRAFPAYSRTTRAERLDLLKSIIATFESRREELAQTVTAEMGSPITFAREVQVKNSIAHLSAMVNVLEVYEFERTMGKVVIRREPVGVCGLITPWNWPLNLIASKLAAALAAGCTVVLKPSEIAPLSALKLGEILHDAGVPSGVFNLVNGDGPTVGEAISHHPDIDMVSFTGSTRAGILVAKAAANTVKRVAQELGGKSANIILPGTDLDKVVAPGVLRGFTNAGQSCQAPTRMLVHASERDAAVAIARRAAEGVRLGDPTDEGTTMGPVVSKVQYDRVQSYIEAGIKEGATLVAGGPGSPSEFNRGHYVRPTVFADVKPDMKIAQEEIFGPVLVMLTYESEDEAVAIANGTKYGLSAYISAPDIEQAKRLADRLEAGRVYLNGAPLDQSAPFGGYKQSGNGREQGIFGLESYLEVKAILGYQPAVA